MAAISCVCVCEVARDVNDEALCGQDLSELGAAAPPRCTAAELRGTQNGGGSKCW